MPTVQQYGSQRVGIDVVGQPRAQATQRSNAGLVAQGLQNASQDLASLAATQRERKVREDTAYAEDAIVRFEREKNNLLFNPDTGYFNTQGRTAYENSSSVNADLEKLQSDYESEFTSEEARTMFNQSATTQLSRVRVDVDRHASSGLRAWESANLAAQVESSIETAALRWNDPASVKLQNALGRQSIIDKAKMEGITGAALNEQLQTYDSSFAKATITAAIGTSAAAGRDALDKYGSSLEPNDLLRTQAVITQKEKAEKVQAVAAQAVLTATSLTDQYETRGDIRDEVNKIDDPALRKQTMKESMHQFDIKRRAASEARGDAFETAESHLLEGGSAESFKAQYPESWERLSPSQKKKIESGKATVTDWNTFSDVLTMSREELAKVDPTDYFDKLAPPERNKLISAVKAANGTGSQRDKIDHQVGRSRTVQTTAAVERLLGQNKSKWNDDKKLVADNFYSLLDEEVRFREEQKGSNLSSEEFTSVLSDLTRKAVIDKEFLGIISYETEQSLTDTLTELAGDADVDDVQLREITSYLRSQGKAVNSRNIIELYNQVK